MWVCVYQGACHSVCAPHTLPPSPCSLSVFVSHQLPFIYRTLLPEAVSVFYKVQTTGKQLKNRFCEQKMEQARVHFEEPIVCKSTWDYNEH